jgi:hypothetical protein
MTIWQSIAVMHDHGSGFRRSASRYPTHLEGLTPGTLHGGSAACCLHLRADTTVAYLQGTDVIVHAAVGSVREGIFGAAGGVPGGMSLSASRSLPLDGKYARQPD